MNSSTKEERKKKRLERKAGVYGGIGDDQDNNPQFARRSIKVNEFDDTERFQTLMSRNEDDLLQFVAKVNKVYQELLKRDAPFMTFVFCGMQSSGKSTIMERFLNSVLNIIQEGTGTRCPLDATCIHDSSCIEPKCELSGTELPESMRGKNLPVDEVFQRITKHNQDLGANDKFSTASLHLVFRANNVQNMRFVDTPGIISNKSTGSDNREDIKKILRHEMKKANTKLCVLLEPKEFATNPIVDFCDESLGGRDNWIDKATFLMTKFDKQLDDSRSASKANNFFSEFCSNKCFPHLVITSTLARENLPALELFKERTTLIQSADEYEEDKFEQWLEGHEQYRRQGEDDVELSIEMKDKIGFPTAKKMMREIRLKDTVSRLPEVVASLRSDLDRCHAEQKVLNEKKDFNDAKTLRLIIFKMVAKIQEKILNYLDGDLDSSIKFPEKLQTLDDEINGEDDSDWSSKELNFHSEKEDSWRDRIANLTEYPEEIHPEARFLGGKQYQRAVAFFRAVMTEALPDPHELKAVVPNVTGYLSGGLQRENWERAMVEITKVSLKEVSHPGINYLIKHVGYIFRNLFLFALDDIKQGEEFSAQFKLIPSGMEKFLINEFDDMLWDLLKVTSSHIHFSMEPMYSSIDPNLPTLKFQDTDDEAVKEKETDKGGFLQGMKNALLSATSTKDYLKWLNKCQATKKLSFLPDKRSMMITSDETDIILQRSFEYIFGLFEFNLFVYKFQMNHHLYEGFKSSLKIDFMNRVADANWDELVRSDPSIDIRLNELDLQISGLVDSLQDVIRMQRSL